MPNNINVVYISLKSTFSVLQFCRWQYGSILIRLAVVAYKSAKSREISRKSDLQQFMVIQGHRHRSWCQSKTHAQSY